MRGPRTAAEHQARGWRLVAHCKACGHGADLPLDKVAAIFGGADLLRHPTFRQRIPCTECGHRDVLLSSTSARQYPGPLPVVYAPPKPAPPPCDPTVEEARRRGSFP